MPTILVVEEEPVFREILRIVLARAGFTICQAADGIQGLEEIAGVEPDLILSDLVMARMDGMELLRAIRSSPKTSHIPFIMVTARAAAEEEALKLGANDFILKPWQYFPLLAKIRNALDPLS